MTVPQSSSGRFNWVPLKHVMLGIFLLIAIGLIADRAVFAEDDPAPADPAPTAEPAEGEAPQTPAPAPAVENPAPAPAEEAPAPKADEPTPLPPKPEEPAAEASPAETPAEGKEKAPANPPAETEPAAPTEEAPKADEPAPLPPKPEEPVAEASPEETPAEAKEEAPTNPSAETAPAAAPEEAPKADEPAPLPPKPAEADVLDTVVSGPDTAKPEDESALSEPAEPVEPAEPAPAPAPASETSELPAEEAEEAGESEEAEEAEGAEEAEVATEDTSAPSDTASPSDVDESEMEIPEDLAKAMDDFVDGKEEPAFLRFAFRHQPWEEVIQWFADQADLSLLMEVPPPGTFNYTDRRSYTPAQALDLMNSILLIKGYTLLRKDRILMVINLDEDPIPDELVTTIPLEDLDNCGAYELVAVLFQLNKFEPDDAAKEIEKLIGPEGKVDVLPKTRQLYVRETGGRLRTIRSIIQRVEDPQGLASGKLQNYEFKNILPDEGLVVLRQLMKIPADANATEDDSFRFAMDPMGTRVYFSGSANRIAEAQGILQSIDLPSGDGETTATLESPQLEVYGITRADPESVLKVMQTLLQGLPGVRLSVDPKTNSLIALARPNDHKTIRATLDQMEAQVRRIEMITLRRLDPQVAAASIKKMFGDSSDEKNTTAPIVEADTLGRQLIVNGTENQIAQIRVLLTKMGETEFGEGPVPTGDRVRVLSLSSPSAELALQNLRMIWPTVSKNPIREITPSANRPPQEGSESIPSIVPSRSREPESFERPTSPDGMPPVGPPRRGRGPEMQRPSAPPAASSTEPRDDRQTSSPNRNPFHFAVQTQEGEKPVAAEESPSDKKADEASEPAPPAAVAEAKSEPAPAPAEADKASEPAPAAPDAAEGVQAPKAKSPIVISRGPAGLMIASDDVEALDEFERLFNSMTGGADPDRTELNIFYLKYAKAQVVADTLTKIIGSGTTGSATASEDSILGELVGGALGTMGGLMNLGMTTLSPTGMLRITAEPRLNALIVEANATDLHTIEEVLKLLDQPKSPEEVLVEPQARLVQVYNMPAEEVAEIVKEVFAEKMQGAAGRNQGGGNQQRPSPADFIAAMRGGRGGSSQRGGNSQAQTAQEAPENMTVGVDARSNSLIVFSTLQTYEEVEDLVKQLDSYAALASDEATEVVTVSGDPEAMKAALMAIIGENAVSSSSSSSNRRSSTNNRSSSSSRSGVSTDVRQRMMQAMMGGGRGGGGMSGGGMQSGGRGGSGGMQGGGRGGGGGGGGRGGGR